MENLIIEEAKKKYSILKQKEIAQQELCDAMRKSNVLGINIAKNKIKMLDKKLEDYAKRFKEIIIAGKKPSENKTLIIVGGQSGAGKSRLVRLAQNDLMQNGVIVDYDEIRSYHPDYERTNEEYPEITHAILHDDTEFVKKAILNGFVKINGILLIMQTDSEMDKKMDKKPEGLSENKIAEELLEEEGLGKLVDANRNGKLKKFIKDKVVEKLHETEETEKTEKLEDLIKTGILKTEKLEDLIKTGILKDEGIKSLDVENGLIEENYNVIYEGALRNTQGFLDFAQDFRDNDYNIRMMLMAVPALESYGSTFFRYAIALQTNKTPRWVEKYAHDGSYEGVLRTVEKFKEQYLVDSIGVYVRSKEEPQKIYETQEHQFSDAIEAIKYGREAGREQAVQDYQEKYDVVTTILKSKQPEMVEKLSDWEQLYENEKRELSGKQQNGMTIDED